MAKTKGAITIPSFIQERNFPSRMKVSRAQDVEEVSIPKQVRPEERLRNRELNKITNLIVLPRTSSTPKDS